MTTQASEVEIELDSGLTRTPVSTEQDGGEGDKALKSGSAISDDDIRALRADLENARKDRDAAKRGETVANTRVAQTEQQARENAARLANEVNARIEDQAATIESGLIAAQGEIDALRDGLAKALEENKWADAARIQEEMADAKLRMRELTYSKGEIARTKEAAKNAPKVQPQAAPGVGAKTQTWIAAHPKFNTDPSYRAKALWAHEEALAAGIPVESDEYFQKVEEMLGERKAAAAEPTANDNDDEPPPSRGVAPVQRRAAPANGNDNGGGRKTIKLTSDQVEAADAMFGDPGSAMYIKDAKERYTYWHTQAERLKSEGRL